MRRICFFAAAALVAAVAGGRVSAQDDLSGAAADVAQTGNYTVRLPSFDARLSMGFNYDLLRSMTGVSFQYPVGYLGFNLPIGYSAGLNDFLDDETMDEIFSGGKIFKKGANFKPTAGAEQNANFSVRVDVPMLAGVGTFAYTQNFFLDFSAAIGGASVINTTQKISAVLDESYADSTTVDGFLAVRAALMLPLYFSMGWETMTFGYAYRVGNNDDLVFALNMHRHLFSADIRLKADIDLLGYASVSANGKTLSQLGGNDQSNQMSKEWELANFSSDRCNGFAQGRFNAEGWTPAIGVKWKRFSLNSRFGGSFKAKGSAGGGFIVPHVVNLETGSLTLGDKFDNFADSTSKRPLYMFSMFDDSTGSIIPKDIDSITYEISDFGWKMPQGHTLSFDIIPQRLAVSYTKIFGEIGVNMDILRTKKVVVRDSLRTPNASVGKSWLDDEEKDIKVDVGAAVDHILVLSASYPSFFANIGVAGFDIRSTGKDGTVKYVLSGNESLNALRVGNVVMLLPIINGGFNLGTKLQLRVEADILPLPAVRSGINYYF
jgi:hypothetical protein